MAEKLKKQIFEIKIFENELQQRIQVYHDIETGMVTRIVGNTMTVMTFSGPAGVREQSFPLSFELDACNIITAFEKFEQAAKESGEALRDTLEAQMKENAGMVQKVPADFLKQLDKRPPPHSSGPRLVRP